jgi:23S rRNA (cytosine1962-C5)-methyltransferase
VTRTTNAYRLLDDAGDGTPGILVDRYADWLVVFVEDGPATLLPSLTEALAGLSRGVYLKHRRIGDARRAERADIAPEAPIAGEPAPSELVVDEYGMQFGVALADGLSTGLFTDQRENRRLVRALSAGARVLNLFAYTGSFSVAAALGGAKETVSVDLSKRALERARTNFERNGVPAGGHRFVKEDAVAYVARALRRGERYDIVVLDPPSFGTGTRRAFSVERDYAPLATNAAALLAPGGRLLAVTNHRKTPAAKLRATITLAARATGRSVAELVELPAPDDHPHRPFGDPVAKSVMLTLA